MSLSEETMQGVSRRIALRSRGQRHGPITRLMGPWADREAQPYVTSELSNALKPFIFLDLFDSNEGEADVNIHPHSGLATLTYLLKGAVRYQDTTGVTGMLPQGAVEWFRAGQGAWHGGGWGDRGHTRGFQLWVALPEEEELGPVESVYLDRELVPHDDHVSLLLGTYKGMANPLKMSSDLTYLSVRLRAGERWLYQPAAEHTVCWAAVAAGQLLTPEEIDTGELVAFEPSNEAIEFEAVSDAEFVLGSAVEHPYELALGRYSVHTNPEALQKGEARIAEIKVRLIERGIL